jgi:hypothetical protein
MKPSFSMFCIHAEDTLEPPDGRRSGLEVMSQFKLISIDHPRIEPLLISSRLRSQLVYFMALNDSPSVPLLGENEYWFSRAEISKWLSEGVFYLVSPLDTENKTEVELSEEQEVLLNWLNRHDVQHVKVIE